MHSSNVAFDDGSDYQAVFDFPIVQWGIAEHALILADALRNIGVKTHLFDLAPAINPVELERRAATVESLMPGAPILTREQFLRERSHFNRFVIPQTPFLDDHYDSDALAKLENARLIYAPYGYAVRQDDFTSSLADHRFTTRLVYSNRHLEYLQSRGLSAIRGGHPSLWWLKERSDFVQKSQTNPDGSGVLRILWTLHWQREYCSVEHSLGAVLELREAVLGFGQECEIRLALHPLFRPAVEGRLPDGYRGAEVSTSVRNDLEEALTEGRVVLTDRNMLSELISCDAVVTDGQGAIAFAASLGRPTAVMQLNDGAKLLQEISSIPVVREFDATSGQLPALILEFYTQQMGLGERRFFQHLGLNPVVSPATLLLGHLFQG